MLRIGVRAHDFGKLPADLLAQSIASKGLSCVQLALNKAIADLELKPGDMTPGLAFEIGRHFRREEVEIAVLGCYINLSHPDPKARAPLVQYFKDHLRHARDFAGAGCAIVATETGSLNPDWSFHPDNKSEEAFRALVPVVADLVAEAQSWGVTVGIEGVASHVLNSPQRIRRLLDEVCSPHLQIVFDPVNLLDIDNHHNQDRIMQESFDLFGDRIAIIHAKDFVPEAGRLKQVRAGKGSLHYPLLLNWLNAHKPGISILLEEASEETAEECIAFLRDSLGSC